MADVTRQAILDAIVYVTALKVTAQGQYDSALTTYKTKSSALMSLNVELNSLQKLLEYHPIE